MKSIALFLLFLGLITLSSAVPSAFLDDLFTPTINSANSALINCSATDTCAGKGDSCGGNYFPAMGGCSKANGTCCAEGLYCVNKTCVTDTYEGLCSTAADCFPVGVFTCYNKTCQYIMGIGEDCSANQECYSGTCANGTCQGSAYGQTCMTDFNCNFGLYCDPASNYTCQNTTAPGQPCAGAAPCSPGNLCFPKVFGNASTCQQIGTQDAGMPCTIGAMGDACQSGLVCNIANPLNMTCISVTTSSVACTADANCTNGACKCSPVTGSSYCVGLSYNNPCTEESINYYQCLAGASCAFSSEAPDSCAQQHCESDYKKSQSCGCSLSNSVLGKCIYNQYCGGFPVWAIIVIIVVAIVLVLAIVLLVFFMMRRRRQYDSI